VTEQTFEEFRFQQKSYVWAVLAKTILVICAIIERNGISKIKLCLFLPEGDVDHWEVVVLVDDGLEPWVEGVGHDFEPGPDAGDDQVDVVARAVVGAEALRPRDDDGDEKRDERLFIHFVWPSLSFDD
jgi:hypothetical protein